MNNAILLEMVQEYPEYKNVTLQTEFLPTEQDNIVYFNTGGNFELQAFLTVDENGDYYTLYTKQEGKEDWTEQDSFSAEVRICATCGERIEDGFYIDYITPEVYCDNGKCLYEHMTQEEYDEMYEEGDAYYTTFY